MGKVMNSGHLRSNHLSVMVVRVRREEPWGTCLMDRWWCHSLRGNSGSRPDLGVKITSSGFRHVEFIVPLRIYKQLS